MKTICVIFAACVLLGVAPALCQTTQPATRPLVGTLVKVDGHDLVITPSHKETSTNDISLATDENTVFTLDGDLAAISDLKPGMFIEAQTARFAYKSEHRPPNAPPRLKVAAHSKGLKGTVRKIDGDNLIIEIPHDDNPPEQITVVIDDKTRIDFVGMNVGGKQYRAALGKPDDLVDGTIVRVIPDTGTAKHIYIYPPPTTTPSTP